MKPTLLILAAGMASRYGSMKQVDGFGPNGETIIDYSIYDAINAGFGKISFIIREEFPRLVVARRVQKDGATYFGPFYPATAMRETTTKLGPGLIAPSRKTPRMESRVRVSDKALSIIE